MQVAPLDRVIGDVLARIIGLGLNEAEKQRRDHGFLRYRGIVCFSRQEYLWKRHRYSLIWCSSGM